MSLLVDARVAGLQGVLQGIAELGRRAIHPCDAHNDRWQPEALELALPEGTGQLRMVDGNRIRGLGVVVDGAQTHLRPFPYELGAAEELSSCLLQPNPRRLSGLELGEPALTLFELHAVLLQLRRRVLTVRRRARKRPGHEGVWVQLVPSDH